MSLVLLKKKDRSVNSFINWIESKINNIVSTTSISSPYKVYNRIYNIEKKGFNKHLNKTHTNKNKIKGGKRSKKYKLSINCNKVKNLSQKQYSKHRRYKG